MCQLKEHQSDKKCCIDCSSVNSRRVPPERSSIFVLKKFKVCKWSFCGVCAGMSQGNLSYYNVEWEDFVTGSGGELRGWVGSTDRWSSARLPRYLISGGCMLTLIKRRASLCRSEIIHRLLISFFSRRIPRVQICIILYIIRLLNLYWHYDFHFIWKMQILKMFVPSSKLKAFFLTFQITLYIKSYLIFKNLASQCMLSNSSETAWPIFMKFLCIFDRSEAIFYTPRW